MIDIQEYKMGDNAKYLGTPSIYLKPWCVGYWTGIGVTVLLNLLDVCQVPVHQPIGRRLIETEMLAISDDVSRGRFTVQPMCNQQRSVSVHEEPLDR